MRAYRVYFALMTCLLLSVHSAAQTSQPQNNATQPSQPQTAAAQTGQPQNKDSDPSWCTLPDCDPAIFKTKGCKNKSKSFVLIAGGVGHDQVRDCSLRIWACKSIDKSTTVAYSSSCPAQPSPADLPEICCDKPPAESACTTISTDIKLYWSSCVAYRELLDTGGSADKLAEIKGIIDKYSRRLAGCGNSAHDFDRCLKVREPCQPKVDQYNRCVAREEGANYSIGSPNSMERADWLLRQCGRKPTCVPTPTS
jgi:hypothetical protein